MMKKNFDLFLMVAALGMTIGLCTLGCGTAEPASPTEAPPKKVEDKSDLKKVVEPIIEKEPTRPESSKVVLIVIDALKASRLGCYGFNEPTSPTIDSIASQGILFEKFHSASPWTAPSFGTMFTGVSPTIHGAGAMLVKGSSKGTSLFGVTVGGIRKDLPTIAELLPDNVKTGAIVNNAFVSKELGFSRGFDYYNHRNARLSRYRTADEATAAAVKWLDENHADPFFLVVHYFDPHMQYGPPKKYVEQFAPNKPRRIPVPFTDHHTARDGSLNPNEDEKRFIRGLYNGEIRFADDQIGELLKAMEGMKLMDDAWIIVTADHGEEQFEHGSFDHGHRYEEELTNIPFIIRAPGGKWKAGTRIKTSTAHVDVLPTVLEIFKTPSRAHFEGRNLMPVIEGKDDKDAEAYMEFNLFNGQQCALFDGRYKLVWNLRTKRGFMYDLQEDPLEVKKLDSTHPKYDEMFEALQKRRKALSKAARGKIQNKAALSEEATKALESLGYVEKEKK